MFFGSWRGRLSRARAIWLAGLLFTVLALLLSYPLSLHPATLRLPTGPDGDLAWYLFAWDSHAFLHQPWALFEANHYYPQHLTLAYGENLIGSAFFAAPVIWLTGNLPLASNVVSLLSCVLCGLGAYVLARRLGLSIAAAIICGIVFECAPPRFFRLGQMHLAPMQWIPFSLAAAHAYLDSGEKRHLRLAAAFVSLQVLSSGHGAVFVAVALLTLGVYRVALGEPLRPIARVRDLGLTGALLLLPSVLVFLPYRAVQQEVGLRRNLGSWGSNYEAFLASPSHLHQFLISAFGWKHITDAAWAYLFPGYLPLLLAIIAIAWTRRAGGPGWSARPASVVPIGAADRAPAASVRAASDVRAAAMVPAETRAMANVQTETRAAAQVQTETRATAWTRAASLLTLAALAFAAVAIVLAWHGRAVRLRLGDSLLLRARSSSRVWGLAAVCLACRLALVSRAPLHVRRRVARVGAGVRRAFSALLEAPATVGRMARAAWERLAPLREWAERRRHDAASFYAVLTLLSLALALGAPYGLWRFVYWLPVLNFIRENSRFTMLALLGLGVLAGIGFDRICRPVPPRWRTVLAVTVSVLLVAEYAAVPMAVEPARSDIPAIDRLRDTRPKPFAIAEVPVYRVGNAGAFERQEVTYMLHSTAHWQRTVHGYHGWRAGLHNQLYIKMQTFPDEASVEALSDLNVTYVVVHTDLYAPAEWKQVEERIGQFGSRLRLKHVEGAGRVYALTKATAGR